MTAKKKNLEIFGLFSQIKSILITQITLEILENGVLYLIEPKMHPRKLYILAWGSFTG